jgi:hypothetical protein
MGFVALLLISLAVNVAGYFIQKALAPRSGSPREQDFTGPKAEAGSPVPVFWGTAMVSPNTVWWGNLLRTKRKQYFYSISQHVLLCWGVVNEIIDISFGGKSARNHAILEGGDFALDDPIVNPGTPSDFIINGNNKARSVELSQWPMFGGDEQGGGVGADVDSQDAGAITMYWGYDDATAQPLDGYLSDMDVYGDHCSRWPNYAYMRMGSEGGTPFYIAAGDGTPKPMSVLMRRTAWWDRMATSALSPLGQTAAEATLGYDANPAEVLYDLLTHRGYGIGRDPASIDLDSFTAVAETLRDEVISPDKTGFGISVTLTKPTDAGQIIRNILLTIDATLATNPVTGKLRLKLIRPDYDVMDLMTISPANSRNSKYSPSVWKETINEVKVTYRRLINDEKRRGFVDDVASDQDQGNWAATGKIRTLPIDLPYITHKDVANITCARIRQAHSVPLARYSTEMMRAGFGLMQGDAVILNDPAWNIEDQVYRVVDINYGSLEDGAISINLVQDVFSVLEATYSTPDTEWEEPEATTEDNSGEGDTPEDAEGIDTGVGFY